MLANTYRVCSAVAGYHATLPRRTIVRVGAPPASVELGLPGAIDEVRAYAARIESAWDNFWTFDVTPWYKKNEIRKLSIIFENEEEDEKLKDLTDEEIDEKRKLVDLSDKLLEERQKFQAFKKDEVDAFNLKLGLIGPRIGISPSEAWQKLQVFENQLKTLRDSFASETDVKLKSQAGTLEEAGGAKQGVKEAAKEAVEGATELGGKAIEGVKEASKAVSSAIPWGTIAIAAGVGLGAVLLLKSK